jgi:cell division protein FtsL
MTRPEKVSKMKGARNASTGIRIRNTKCKRPKFHLTSKQVFLTIVMLFLFMGSGIGYVWSNFEKTQIGYTLSDLKREEMRLEANNSKLRLELAFLKSPQNLEPRAVKQLGLRPPSAEQIITLP